MPSASSTLLVELAALQRELLHGQLKLPAAMSLLAERARTLLSADGFLIQRKSEDGYEVSVAEGLLQPLRARTTAHPLIRTDAPTRARGDALLPGLDGVGLLVVPLHGEHEPAGELIAATRGGAGDEQLAALEALSSVLSTLLERSAVREARAAMRLERSGAISAIKESAELFRSLFDGAGSGMALLSGDGYFRAVNERLCTMLGHTEAELFERRSFLEFIHPDVPLDELMALYQRQGGHWRGEVRMAPSSGQPLWVLLSASAVHNPDGQPMGLVVQLYDRTREHALESQLRVSDRMASVGQLASGVAHELNNPLSFVLSNLSFLRDELAQAKLPEDTAGELHSVLGETIEGAERVRKIVRELQTFARVDADTTRKVDLPAVLSAAIHSVRKDLLQRARVETDYGAVPPLHGNEGALMQVFAQLIQNAMQALPENDPEKHRVCVSARTDAAGWAEVKISDSGKGIPEDLRSRIFDPFFTTKTGGATGLGLSMVHTLLKAHGGEISVESALGKGTTFTVRLPPVADR